MSHRYCYPRAVEIRRCGSPEVRFPFEAPAGAVTPVQLQAAGRSPQLARAGL